RPHTSRGVCDKRGARSIVRWLRLLWLLAAAVTGVWQPGSTARAETSRTNKPAKQAVVKVSGFGLLGNREMLRVLRSFQSNQRFPSVLGRAFVEDAALVLLSRMNQE